MTAVVTTSATTMASTASRNLDLTMGMGLASPELHAFGVVLVGFEHPLVFPHHEARSCLEEKREALPLSERLRVQKPTSGGFPFLRQEGQAPPILSRQRVGLPPFTFEISGHPVSGVGRGGGGGGGGAKQGSRAEGTQSAIFKTLKPVNF